MKFSIEDVKPGMVTANAIRKNDSLILNSNAVLTEKIIEALKKYGVEYIDIQLSKDQDAYLLDRGVESTISPKLKVEAKNSIKNFNTKDIIKNAQLMTSSIIESKDFRYDLSEYKQTVDIFSHSVRVASFAILLAKFYNDSLTKFIFDTSILKKCTVNLESIAVAAMLHDIGKLCEDKGVLQKTLAQDYNLDKFFPGAKNINLEQYDEKYSSIYSYLLLNKNGLLNSDIKMMILLANEPENGSGPLKPNEQYIKSRQSFIYGSKIIRLCSIYDDELSHIINSNESLENISAKLDFLATNGIINDELEELFIRHIPLYSKGVKVKLSNGEYAVVEQSFNNRMFICRPIVRTVPSNKFIDLRIELSLTIKEICSNEISFNEIVNKQIQTMEQEISKNKSI